MRASVVDLRYRMKNVLEAINRNEAVTILYHGKEKAVLTPIDRPVDQKVSDHPFFAMTKEAEETVEETMKRLRGGRY
jgi:antitoxin (DNA-binding transcriptional repressor) of toxin-antitoxin stability system